MSDITRVEKLLLNVEEAGQLASLGRTKCYELIASGAWPSIRVGRAVRIPRAGLLAWVERSQQSAADGQA